MRRCRDNRFVKKRCIVPYYGVMEVLWAYIIFILLNFAKSERLYVSLNESTAVQASSICNLATAELLFSDEQIKLQFNSNDIEEIEDHIDDHETLWIGYTKIYAVFLYRGCTKPSNVKYTMDHTNIQPDPGLCYSFCQSKYIGVEEKRCYCLSVIPEDIQLRDCVEECNQPDDTQCGKEDSYVAIYKRVEYRPVEKSDENDFCRAYDPVKKTYFWARCSAKHGSLCIRDIDSNSTDYIAAENTKKKWLTINNNCLKNKMYPANEQINSVPELSSVSSPLWIGSIRSIIVTPIKDTILEQIPVQGYMENQDDNVFQLEFDEQTNTKRNALCVKDPDSPISRPGLVTTATTYQNDLTGGKSSSSKGDFSTKGSTTDRTEQITDLTLPSEVTHTSETTYSKGSTTMEEKANLVWVYVAIPLILILIVVVGCFVLWRKRRPPSVHKPNDDGAILNDKKTNNGPRDVTSNAVYQNIYPTGTTHATLEHNYNSSELENEYSSIDDPSVKPSYDYAYVTEAGQNGASKPSAFTFNQAPAS